MTSIAPGHGELTELREHTRVMLQPIAAPSILGLFGFAGATFIVAAHLAGWYGTAESPAFLFPFAAMFGGLAQFLAGMWAYKARDGVATAMHGKWGSFWLACGVLNPLAAVGAGFLAVHYLTGAGWWEAAGGWILVGSAVAAATHTAGAMMLEGAWGRALLPLGKPELKANVPGAKVTRPVQFEHAEPGVRMGQ